MNSLIARFLSPFLKAHVAGLSTAGALLIAALSRGHVTVDDVYAIIGGYLGAGALVAAAPNIPNGSIVAPVSMVSIPATIDPAMINGAQDTVGA